MRLTLPDFDDEPEDLEDDEVDRPDPDEPLDREDDEEDLPREDPLDLAAPEDRPDEDGRDGATDREDEPLGRGGGA